MRKLTYLFTNQPYSKNDVRAILSSVLHGSMTANNAWYAMNNIRRNASHYKVSNYANAVSLFLTHLEIDENTSKTLSESIRDFLDNEFSMKAVKQYLNGVDNG